MKDMEKLVNKLNEAAKNYYSESEVTKMSDHEYDQLYDELVAISSPQSEYERVVAMKKRHPCGHLFPFHYRLSLINHFSTILDF